MKVLITGATGFVGIGVLAEALASPAVDEVVSLCRRPSGQASSKLTEVIADDFLDLSAQAPQITDVDACFWCLGTSSGGMEEAAYTRVTYQFTVHAASLLAERGRARAFCFLSGSGADGSAMWAQVKKRTEETLREMSFDSLSFFRPAYIRGFHGAQIRGTAYRIAYSIMRVAEPLVRALGGGTSNSEIGRAMIVAAQRPFDGVVLDSKAINALALEAPSNDAVVP